MAKAIYAGSFDPPTNGHAFMIREGASLFEELVVAIGVNPDKHTSFDTETRVRLLTEIASGLDNVSVATFENQFLIRYAAAQGARYILRGIRNSQDFTYERTMCHVNGDLEKGITTVCPRPAARVARHLVVVRGKAWSAPRAGATLCAISCQLLSTTRS